MFLVFDPLLDLDWIWGRVLFDDAVLLSQHRTDSSSGTREGFTVDDHDDAIVKARFRFMIDRSRLGFLIDLRVDLD
ncbi:hypothetical protein RchiOBHm_Chr7g0225681 [Rosa chinensis]|uniref:Uncharacterized protein n=1 Tax=Rosa chinensis TaxID=74649 RepID=A0A2P6PE62_ROSCH|nr:hypothetical protein RchiOBHm_Chr7g0225681 [Rosa chinensis]